jgi:hypothetical protein
MRDRIYVAPLSGFTVLKELKNNERKRKQETKKIV